MFFQYALLSGGLRIYLPQGVWLLSGRVLDLRLRHGGVEPHRRHYIVP